MKKLHINIICLTILCGIALGYNYNAPFTQAAPTIDGTIQAGEWDNAFSFSIIDPDILSDPFNGSYPSGWAVPANAQDLSADVYMLWDNEFIYISVEVYDSDLNFLNYSGGQFNSQDAVQLMFNPGGYAGHYSSAGAAATIIDLAADTADSAGASFYGRNDPIFNNPDNVIMDASVVTGGYIIELALKNAAFSLQPQLGDSIGLGLILSDADGNTHETLLTDTSTEGTWDVNQTSSWNTLRFVGIDGCGSYGFSSADINKDCLVDLKDLAYLAASWLECTDPTGDDCVTLN